PRQRDTSLSPCPKSGVHLTFTSSRMSARLFLSLAVTGSRLLVFKPFQLGSSSSAIDIVYARNQENADEEGWLFSFIG
ncbi:MAG: hypothetical protein JJU21_17995, partial [Salinarimonas sp.]|nr:hypothetical protein [Salinarimonas sp.]